MTADWVTLDPTKAAQYYVAPLKYTGRQEYEDGTKKVYEWEHRLGDIHFIV